MLAAQPFGKLQVARSTAPNNGDVGFAGGCQYFYFPTLNTGQVFINVGTNLAAQWVRVDGSAFSQNQLGQSALTNPFSAFNSEGNLYRNAGNPIAQNGANTNDDILDGFVLPANAFDQANRQLYLNFNGNFGATGNNKRVRIWVNPTMAGQTITNGVISGGTVTGAGSGVLLFDSGTQTGNAIGYQLDLIFCKYGATGSNTQLYMSSPIFATTHGGTSGVLFSTIPENAPMNFVFTGASQTTGAAGDVVHCYTEINAMN